MLRRWQPQTSTYAHENTREDAMWILRDALMKATGETDCVHESIGEDQYAHERISKDQKRATVSPVVCMPYEFSLR